MEINMPYHEQMKVIRLAYGAAYIAEFRCEKSKEELENEMKKINLILQADGYQMIKYMEKQMIIQRILKIPEPKENPEGKNYIMEIWAQEDTVDNFPKEFEMMKQIMERDGYPVSHWQDADEFVKMAKSLHADRAREYFTF